MAVMERTEGVKMKVPRDLWRYRLLEKREQRVITNETFEMMARVYGLSYPEVAAAESALLNAPPLPCVVSHPCLVRILEVDADSL